jgi:hypothetical protein
MRAALASCSVLVMVVLLDAIKAKADVGGPRYPDVQEIREGREVPDAGR